MFKHFIQQLSGDENYLIFSLLVFFGFFLLVAVYLFFMKKEYIEEMSNMPIIDQNKQDEEV
ncbi:hypothetical protein [Pedobacter flavus]|uniref:CcoQ/FixQ family Cbb3-type cytochrome c oxidase assembly chaperone n=1 Tax=Pedobacter flavus TaxID=3113906 RepID=A0ABU7H3H8_9SPHI|nr:hypothetical protein [Pedobacter sp. VNH31]MEE1885809.1 hypothetical protein [Pedobacter sp. VNH31]